MAELSIGLKPHFVTIGALIFERVSIPLTSILGDTEAVMIPIIAFFIKVLRFITFLLSYNLL